MSLIRSVLPLAAVLSMGGCYVEPVPAGVEVTSAPIGVGIEASPWVYWDGHPTYYYGGRWYYRGAHGRWSYYRVEPHGLYRYHHYHR